MRYTRYSSWCLVAWRDLIDEGGMGVGLVSYMHERCEGQMHSLLLAIGRLARSDRRGGGIWCWSRVAVHARVT